MAQRPGIFQRGDTGRSDSRNLPEEEHLRQRGERQRIGQKDDGGSSDGHRGRAYSGQARRVRDAVATGGDARWSTKTVAAARLA